MTWTQPRGPWQWLLLICPAVLNLLCSFGGRGYERWKAHGEETEATEWATVVYGFWGAVLSVALCVALSIWVTRNVEKPAVRLVEVIALSGILIVLNFSLAFAGCTSLDSSF